MQSWLVTASYVHSLLSALYSLQWRDQNESFASPVETQLLLGWSKDGQHCMVKRFSNVGHVILKHLEIVKEHSIFSSKL